MIGVSGLSLLPESARRRNLIKRAVRRTLHAEKAVAPGDINIIFVDRKKMLSLNKRFLNRSHDTDVIAFNYNYDFPKGAHAPFGDVFISSHQARLQAAQLGHSVLQEVLTLAIHGTLHLLGYDDATPRQKALMFKKQDQCLAALGLP